MLRTRYLRHPVVCAGLVACGVGTAQAGLVDVRIDGPTDLEVGDSGMFTIVAELSNTGSAGLVGWGLDLEADASLVRSAPTLGALWTPVATPDGDGLAGLFTDFASSPSGLLNGEFELATIELLATSEGVFSVDASFSAGDPTEGFVASGGALFDIGTFSGAVVEVGTSGFVIPLPAPALMAGLPVAVIALRRNRSFG